jgi:hypothetical protein
LTSPQNSADNPPRLTLARWLVRLVLAALLAFGSEIFLWIDPPARSPLEWALLLPGYLALSAFLLDTLVRFRVVELFGLLTLAGLYGLLAGLVLNPQMALENMPSTLVTRVMGAHALLGLVMLVAFLLLTGQQTRRARLLLLVGSGVVGLAWGVWAHWYTVQLNQGQIALQTMLLWGAGGLALIILLLTLISPRTRSLTPAHLLLPLEHYVVVVGLLLALLVVRLAQGLVDSLALSIIPPLIGFCLLILWFQKRVKNVNLLDSRLPMSPPTPLWLVTSVLIFLASGAVGYSLPRGANPDADQFGTLVALFAMYGLLWLPTSCLVLGVRGYRRMTRAGRL